MTTTFLNRTERKGLYSSTNSWGKQEATTVKPKGVKTDLMARKLDSLNARMMETKKENSEKYFQLGQDLSKTSKRVESLNKELEIFMEKEVTKLLDEQENNWANTQREQKTRKKQEQ